MPPTSWSRSSTSDGAVVRLATRAEMRAGNLRHRSVAVVVVTSAGEVVAHRRADWKDVWPGRWDVCFGGVVGVGEDWTPRPPGASWPRRRGSTVADGRAPRRWARELRRRGRRRRYARVYAVDPRRAVPPGRRRGRRAGARAAVRPRRMARRPGAVRRHARPSSSPSCARWRGGIPHRHRRTPGDDPDGLVTAPSYRRPCHTGKAMRRAAGVDDESRAARWREPAALWAAGPTTRRRSSGHGGASPSRLTSPRANGTARRHRSAAAGCVARAPQAAHARWPCGSIRP